jgi:hypothetical protein
MAKVVFERSKPRFSAIFEDTSAGAVGAPWDWGM